MSASTPARRLSLTLIAPFPWALLLFQLLIVVPRYDVLFRQFGLVVPLLTVTVLDVARWAGSHVVLAFLLAIAGTGYTAILARAASSTKSRPRRYLILLVAFGLPCLLFALAWVGVELAHRKLDDGLAR